MYPGTHARRHPDKAAVIAAESGAVLTYRELDDASMRLARLLHDAGLRPGQHIAFLSNNRLEVFGIYWAALRSGLYVTAINHHLSPDEIAYIVNDCGAEALIVSADLAEPATAILSSTPQVRLRLAFGGVVDGYDSYEQAVAAQPAEPLDDEPRGADMLYSSGTTGRPKGIKGPRPERTIHEPDPYATLFAAMYGFDDDTVYYSAAPIYHAAPLRFTAFIHSHGGTVVMAPQFDPRAALEAIQEYGATHSQWVPTMFVRMLKLPDNVRSSYDVSSMKVAVHAAAPCPVDVKRAMIDWWGPVLYEYYSSTEGNGVTFIGPQEWLARPGSVGRSGLGTIRICDDNGAEVPIGQTGVIYFERDIPAFQYHNDDDKTLSARHPEHELWTTTGDIGYLDDDGYLFLTDRKAFMIISGGVNIYPQEIEDCLTMHPSVLDVAVIGIPDAEMGEQVCAVVQVAPGVTPSEDLAAELKDFVRSRIARYKVPRVVDFVDVLPRSAAGKLVKRILKQRYTDPSAAPRESSSGS
jgi:acyl-CoA synthetase (AMP-forming)/AMP-acid ligase II